MALVTLLMAVMLTSVARLERYAAPLQASPPPQEDQENPSQDRIPTAQGAHWKAWAANLALTSLGLVAVLAGNMLTLLLAWVALDIIEGLILFGQGASSEERGQVVRVFSTRLGGVVTLMLAGIICWSQGEQFNFDMSSDLATLFLFAAAGLRLGILPIFTPLFRELSMRVGLGTILRLIPVASSLMLLVRCANTGAQGISGLVLLGFAALAGLVGGIGWLRAQDELAGRPYWILATTSLVMAAAILRQPTTSLAWSLVVLLPGSLLFLSSLKNRLLFVIWLLGIMGLIGLPFTPAWIGTNLFQMSYAAEGFAAQSIVVLLGLIFFIVHVFLVAGYVVLILRGISHAMTEQQPKVDRWVWLLYLPGLLSLPILHGVLSWAIQPGQANIPLVMWVEGASASGIAAAIWYYISRPTQRKRIFFTNQPWFSSGRIYQPISQLFDVLAYLIAQIIKVTSNLLEGEAGILWAIVLLVLSLAFLQQY